MPAGSQGHLLRGWSLGARHPFLCPKPFLSVATSFSPRPGQNEAAAPPWKPPALAGREGECPASGQRSALAAGVTPAPVPSGFISGLSVHTEQDGAWSPDSSPQGLQTPQEKLKGSCSQQITLNSRTTRLEIWLRALCTPSTTTRPPPLGERVAATPIHFPAAKPHAQGTQGGQKSP